MSLPATIRRAWSAHRARMAAVDAECARIDREIDEPVPYLPTAARGPDWEFVGLRAGVASLMADIATDDPDTWDAIFCAQIGVSL